MSRVSIEEIKSKVYNIFVKEGADEKTAAAVTEVIADTQMKGIITHGFVRVAKYVECLRSGGVKPTGDITVITDTPSMALATGNAGLGIAIARNAMELAISKAEATGVGIVFVRGSHHLGATGYYANMCAERGMIGLAMSNGDPLVAATGSRVKSIGNNPFAYAFPAGKHGSVIYDVAISCGSDMKVIAMEKNGEKAPDGWLIDKNGNPTNNPADYLNGGVLLPFGGYKGYGLAVMVELFGAAVAGANMLGNVSAWNKTPSEEGGNLGQFFMAIDPSKVTDRDAMIARAEDMIDKLLSSERAEGVDKIYYPGEKEKISKERCLALGTVEVADEVLAKIDELIG